MNGVQRYKTKYYNLDAIISIDYQVNSQNATIFRIWENKVLKEYLVKGYTINEKIKYKQYEELKQTVKLLSNVIQNKELSADEATELEGNGILYNPDGTKRIENNALAALTLMIAESRTEEKEIITKVVVNLINNNN